MKITLKQDDIEQALKMHLDSQGILLADRSFEVTFKAGRKGSGLSATVTIGLPPVMLTAVKPVLVEAEVIHAVEEVTEPVYMVEPAEPAFTVTKVPFIPTIPTPMFSPEAPETVPSLVTEEPVPEPTPIKTPSLFA